jgi:geranylgeranyl pyrophosphate synthase
MNKERIEATEALNANIYKSIYPVFKTQFGFNQDTVDEFFTLLEKRFINGQCFRPYYVKVMHDYIKACMTNEKISTTHLESERMKQLLEVEIPFFAETIIIIQYLDNHILDEKNGISENNLALKNTLLSAGILKDYLFKYVNHLDNFKDKSEECIIKMTLHTYLQRIFLYVNIGQKIELKWNRYHVLKNNIKPEKSPFGQELEDFIDFEPMQEIIDFIYEQFDESYHTYLELYLKRIYLTTGSLFILISDLMVDLMQYEGKEKKNINSFSKCFGMLSQIVNDNCDIVPSYTHLTTNAKVEKDAFSDLRNGNITLPLLLHLKSTKRISKVRNFLNTNHIIFNKNISNKKYMNEINQKYFFDEIKESEAIYHSISIGKLFALKAKQFVSQNLEKKISNILSVATWNKFYYEIYKEGTRFYKPNNKNIFRMNYNNLKEMLKFKKMKKKLPLC